MQSFSSASLKLLFTYPFRQPGWQTKLLILGLLTVGGLFIPIIPWLFVYGYMAEMARRQALGEGEPALPEWDDWGGYLTDGLRLLGVSLFYIIPVSAVMLVGFGIYFFSIIGAAVASGNSRGGDMVMLPVMMGSMMVLFGAMGLGMLLSVGLGVIFPAPLVHVAVKKSFGALFQVKEWWQIFRANFGGYLIGLALVFATTMLYQLAVQMLVWTFILCLAVPVLMLMVTPYLAVFTSILYGQLYREGLEAVRVKAAKVEAVQPDPESGQQI